ncbi:hypothetical protein DIPPA_10346 [Diplonema papillatum]|nr:hypothetical protein DIPPA_10346 [Diplonema papillatum]
MVWGRQSTSTVFFVAIWAAYTGFLFLNVAIEEAIGVQAPLETQEVVNNYKVVMSCWTFVGVFGFCAFIFGLTMTVVAKGCGFRVYADVVSASGILALAYSLVVWVTMITLGFLEPNDQWRLIRKSQHTLASGGVGYRDCAASRTGPFTVPDNETYVILQGDGWRVDTGDNESVVEFGWSYVTAPIVYEGPGEPCWFEPPIRAVCAQRSPSPESCFFEPVGRDTVIRRAEEVEYFESFIVDKMPLAGGSRGQLFEFNAKPRSSLVDYVSRMKTARTDQWARVSIAWFVLSSSFLGIAIFSMYS